MAMVMVMAPVVVVPPVVMPSIIVMAPVAEMTDTPRPVMGQDHPAAAVRVRVIVGVVAVVGRSDKEAPVKTMMPERDAAVANAAVKSMNARRHCTVKGRSCAESA